MKESGGGGAGRFPSLFLPHPLPALLLAPFFARCLTLVPRSLLLNRTETLATQAKDFVNAKTHAREKQLLTGFLRTVVVYAFSENKT